jgi:hypothetical protein
VNQNDCPKKGPPFGVFSTMPKVFGESELVDPFRVVWKSVGSLFHGLHPWLFTVRPCGAR